MFYSNACQYAIRAMVYLARHHDRPCLAREISQQMGIPFHYLAKILGDLNKDGLLRSTKGRTGGFQLAHRPSEITLFDVKEAIDGTQDLKRCAVGISFCSDKTPCPIHDTFAPIRASIRDYLKSTTLEAISAAFERKETKLKRASGKQEKS